MHIYDLINYFPPTLYMLMQGRGQVSFENTSFKRQYTGECRLWACKRKWEVRERPRGRGTHAALSQYECRWRCRGTRRRVRRGCYLQAERFPAHVPEQRRRGAQSVLGPLLQREDDSARVLPQGVDQVLQLPAHLRSTHTHTHNAANKQLHTHFAVHQMGAAKFGWGKTSVRRY